MLHKVIRAAAGHPKVALEVKRDAKVARLAGHSTAKNNKLVGRIFSLLHVFFYIILSCGSYQRVQGS